MRKIAHVLEEDFRTERLFVHSTPFLAAGVPRSPLPGTWCLVNGYTYRRDCEQTIPQTRLDLLRAGAINQAEYNRRTDLDRAFRASYGADDSPH